MKNRVCSPNMPYLLGEIKCGRFYDEKTDCTPPDRFVGTFLEGSQLYGEQMIHDFEPSSELIQEYA